MKMASATFRQVDITPTDEKIRRTVRIVHERFGGDITAFIKHAREKRESERAKEEPAKQELEAAFEEK
jgi:hypothetical protein